MTAVSAERLPLNTASVLTVGEEAGRGTGRRGLFWGPPARSGGCGGAAGGRELSGKGKQVPPRREGFPFRKKEE